MLIDEWELEPNVRDRVRRAVDDDPTMADAERKGSTLPQWDHDHEAGSCDPVSRSIDWRSLRTHRSLGGSHMGANEY